MSLFSIPPSLTSLGFTPFFHQQFLALLASEPEWSDHEPQRIVADRGSEYVLIGPGGTRRGVLAGRLTRELTEDARPCVGDFVLVPRGEVSGAGSHAASELARIDHVFERSSLFRRKAAGATSGAQALAANIDVAFIVSALSPPSADPHAKSHSMNAARLTRYLHAVREAPARAVIVLNKADLSAKAEAEAEALARALHVSDVIAVSAETGQGFERLTSHLERGMTAVFTGSSGVGKSSLINAWLGRSEQKTSAVRASDTRGRHTTTHRELFTLESGGLLIDTPGMREFGLFAGEASLRVSGFDDVDALAEGCRFRDCTHTQEPGCAVLAAVASGELAPERLAQAGKLQREIAHQKGRQDALQRMAERRQGRALSRAVRAVQRVKR